jgi:hypothetical protein
MDDVITGYFLTQSTMYERTALSDNVATCVVDSCWSSGLVLTVDMQMERIGSCLHE